MVSSFGPDAHLEPGDVAVLPENPFHEWLLANLDQIKNGGAMYNGQRVTPESNCVRYYYCMSFIFVSSWNMSKLLLEHSEEARKERIKDSLISGTIGIFGIFGIFLGPYYLIRNILGGRKIPMKQILEDPSIIQRTWLEVKTGPGPMILSFVGLLVVLGLILQVVKWAKHLGH